MTKLIVGCGYLGRRVAGRWLAAGESVVGVVSRDEQAAELQRLGVRPLVADVTQPATLAQLPPAETVLYAVGYDPRDGRTRWEVYADGLRNTLAALPSSPERIIFISSTGVYGQDDGSWVDEDSPCRPKSESGRALLAAEEVLHDHPLGSCGIVLRLAGIYGPGRLPRRGLPAGLSLPIAAESVANLIHVDDAATVILAAESRAPLPRTYLVSDGHPVARSEFLSFLAELFRMSPRVRAHAGIPMSAGRENRRGGDKRVNNRRMLAELGVALAYPTYRQGLPNAVGFAGPRGAADKRGGGK